MKCFHYTRVMRFILVNIFFALTVEASPFTIVDYTTGVPWTKARSEMLVIAKQDWESARTLGGKVSFVSGTSKLSYGHGVARNEGRVIPQALKMTGSWRRNITATVFWVGEDASQNNPVHNHASAWDGK